jgi:hypothetical protein
LVNYRSDVGKEGGEKREELATHPVPSRTVLCGDGFDVSDPVAVPAPEGTGVVDADGVDSGDVSFDQLEEIAMLTP